MMIMKRIAMFLLFTACGDDGGGGGGGGGGLSCSSKPACLTEAIAALQACVATPTLTLGTPTNNSGVVENLRCMGGDLVVGFSTFSFSPGGTVPLPSSTTLTVGGTRCADIGRGTGTSMMGGTTRSFDFAEIEIPGAAPVTINTYDNGDIGVQCGDSRSEEVTASGASLAACGEDFASPTVVRNDAITMMGVELVEPAGASTPLFTCTR